MSKVNNIDAMLLVTTAMQHASAKQEIIADNLANANTPGAFAKTLADLSETDFKRPKVSLAVTNHNHLEGSSSAGGAEFEVKVDRDLSNMTPSGNNISVSKEMEALSRNNLDYAIYVDIYTKLRDFERKATEG